MPVTPPDIPVGVIRAYETDESEYGRFMVGFLSYIDTCWSHLGDDRTKFLHFLYSEGYVDVDKRVDVVKMRSLLGKFAPVSPYELSRLRKCYFCMHWLLVFTKFQHMLPMRNLCQILVNLALCILAL